ncbi:hypothetical protein NTH44_003346 [Vibrio metoecus]|nr:hypothetical protein [Vibrio cholerae]
MQTIKIHHEHWVYNEMVLANAVNFEGYSLPVNCLRCNKEASERHFDLVEGGSVNPYYSIDCSHCGYHKCDRNFCSTCEAESAYFDSLMKNYSEAILLLDSCIDDLELGLKTQINGIHVTHIKILIAYAREDLDWYNEDFLNRGGISRIKRRLLDAKFTRNLKLKIAQAHHDLA